MKIYQLKWDNKDYCQKIRQNKAKIIIKKWKNILLQKLNNNSRDWSVYTHRSRVFNQLLTKRLNNSKTV